MNISFLTHSNILVNGANPNEHQSLCPQFSAGIYSLTVMPAVAELAPVVIGRGKYPSSKLR
jgi:hypothetical protein